MTEIINGKDIASKIRADIKEKTTELKQKNVVPGLAVVLIGEDPASMSYVTAKEKACEENGITSFDHRLSVDTSEEELLTLIDSLNSNPEVHGILVQLPLPDHINEDKVIARIDPDKDVDGFHPVSVGKMMLGQETFLPCTPHGILKLLEFSQIDPEGKQVLVIGRSNIVGKPVANMLLAKQKGANATVTVCHSRSKNIKELCLQADIIIAAIGKAAFVTPDMVKKGTVVIDVGVNRVEDSSKKRGYRLVGDVDFDGLQGIASHITPVPGGVGPMTITMLLFNTLESAIRHNQ